MKKTLCMIALAAISFGSVYAAVPVKMAQDTSMTKTKMKKHHMKMKKKTMSADSSKMKM